MSAPEEPRSSACGPCTSVSPPAWANVKPERIQRWAEPVHLVPGIEGGVRLQPKRDAAGRLAAFERQTLVNRKQGGLSLSLSRPGKPLNSHGSFLLRPATRLEPVKGSIMLPGHDQYRERSRGDGFARRSGADGSRWTAPTSIGEMRMHSESCDSQG